ncbi:MAG: cardiolipin synthase [Deltaproteobacteria bacterium]|nr:cardiolipin synthase [Deltaproteobacteria bacterium]
METTALHWSYSLFCTVILLADLFIRIGLSLRVIMRKRPYGVSLAWLIVILLIPFVGGFFYLLFGENRISERRVERARMSSSRYQHWLKTLRERAPVSWSGFNQECEPLHRQAETLVGIPAMAGNQLQLIDHPEEILASILKDIEMSQSTCHLQFYIWEEGGRVDKIAEALIQAASRGVVCRILLDSIGSRSFLKSKTAAAMKSGGVKIEESLPAGIIRLLFSRIDIRNHRKIVVIDGKTAYTGSQNMVDPDMFKADAGVGNWIDVMVKADGPVVEILGGTFINDWFLETDIDQFQSSSLLEDIQQIRRIGDIHPRPVTGKSAVQIVPSGPGLAPEAIHSLLLTTIYAARHELIMTTPYFIPDEPLLAALKAAGQRGVDVKIIVPEKNDSIMVKYASRARYEDLSEAGVKFFLFKGGLLHSKTVTVDRDFSLLGSVNLDMRSFWLNFEATLFIYCREFTNDLLEVQFDYLKQAEELDITSFAQRSLIEKFKENLSLLVSPLL